MKKQKEKPQTLHISLSYENERQILNTAHKWSKSIKDDKDFIQAQSSFFVEISPSAFCVTVILTFMQKKIVSSYFRVFDKSVLSFSTSMIFVTESLDIVWKWATLEFQVTFSL